MRTKFQKYMIEYPSGQCEEVRIPYFFRPLDVIRALSDNCKVQLVLGRNQTAIVEGVVLLVIGYSHNKRSSE